ALVNGRRFTPAIAAHPKRVLAVTGAAAAVAALLAGGLVNLPATRGSPRAGPNTVAVIDGSRNAVSAVVAGAGRPRGGAHRAGAPRGTDTAHDQLLRGDPAARGGRPAPARGGPR